MQYCSYQITIFANLPPPIKYRLVRPAPPAPPRYASGNNGPSIKNAVVGEEKMRSGHRLGLVPCVPFSVLGGRKETWSIYETEFH